MGHTPGPWVNDGSHPEWERNVVWAGDVVVAHAVDDQHGNADANARLIAAAPGLLSACRCALADLEGMCGLVEEDHPCFETIEELKAAIEKAEGGE